MIRIAVSMQYVVRLLFYVWKFILSKNTHFEKRRGQGVDDMAWEAFVRVSAVRRSVFSKELTSLVLHPWRVWLLPECKAQGRSPRGSGAGKSRGWRQQQFTHGMCRQQLLPGQVASLHRDGYQGFALCDKCLKQSGWHWTAFFLFRWQIPSFPLDIWKPFALGAIHTQAICGTQSHTGSRPRCNFSLLPLSKHRGQIV